MRLPNVVPALGEKRIVFKVFFDEDFGELSTCVPIKKTVSIKPVLSVEKKACMKLKNVVYSAAYT